MSAAPFFSIVTPTYNRAHYLKEMMESVQAQTFKDYEHIIVDDGSTDNSDELIRSFQEKDDRIIYIKQENKGRSTARNVGIKTGKGQYICFLDSDDLWRPEHLETLHKETSDTVSPTMFVTGLTWFVEDENREEDVIYRPRHLYSSDAEYAIVNQFAPDSVCLHREIAQKHRFNPALFVNEDAELWGRVAAEYPVKTIEKNTAILRVHDTNTSKTEERFMREARRVFQLQLNTPSVRNELSDAFIRDRTRGLHELTIKHYRQTEGRLKFLWWTGLFILRYPTNPSVLDKLKRMGRALIGAKIS